MKGRCPLLMLLAIWGALGGLGHSWELGSLADNDGGVPSPQDFIRRGCHTVAVIGDYLYLDGGQVTESVNGTKPADINTWSIDLTKPWTNDTVKIRSIQKIAPSLSKQVHWVDSTTNSLYTWGGFTVDETSPNPDLWRFATDGSGGGVWAQVTQRDYLNFSKLKTIFGAAFTQTKDVGFALGGAAIHASDSTVQKDIPGYATPGLISYNFRTGTWGNSSTSAYGGYGTSLNGRAEYVPFGPNGLIIFLGGAESPVDATNETIVEMNWNTITLVDPVTKKWYKQSTSGSKPPTVESHCTVGVLGPDGTYEIFIYGGVSDQIRATSSDITVLSLPGFVFFKGPSHAPPRSDHQCAIVGRGQRQMLSAGGVDGENRTFTAPTTADPWIYGIGILDMTELEWKDSYDPDAAAYDSPTVVKEWYSAGRLRDVRWDDDELGRIMTNKSAPMPSPLTNRLGNKPHSTAAIVGGVIGGIAAAVALGILILGFVRRRRKQATTPESACRVVPGNGDREDVPEYKPEPWPKDHARYYSPDSVMDAGPKSLSISPYPVEIEGTWCGDFSHHQDGVVRVRDGEIPGTIPTVGELADPNIQWAHELPAPLENTRTELPDRSCSP
ncbi:hypothetical protein GGS20DRAFT_580893 [Poronia punctata]|nr:hypothetical protein GGS20DRAFT_580893 [Poronia punctata]